MTTPKQAATHKASNEMRIEFNTYGTAMRHRRGQTNRERPTILKSGTNDYFDPDWMLIHSTLDEIEMWLMDVHKCLNTKSKDKRNNERPLYSEWERTFFDSVNAQYDKRHAAGFHEHPLTGKQLVFLHRMWKRLATNTVEILARGVDGEERDI